MSMRGRQLPLPRPGTDETYQALDTAISDHFDGRLSTAVLAQLDLGSGALRWVSAGHPPPLLIRLGRSSRPCRSTPRRLDCRRAFRLPSVSTGGFQGALSGGRLRA
jgi:hypothetical protein